MQARLLTTAPEKAEADALILPIFEGQSTLPPEAAALDRKLKGAITQLLADREFRGKFMELVPVHNLNTLPSKWTVLVGVGKAQELDMVRLRNVLQSAGRVLRKRGHRRVTVLLPKDVAARAGAADVARAVTEGIGLSNFDVGSLKTRHEQAVTQISTLSIVGLDGDKAASAAVKDAVVLADATNRIREWVNAPANAFTPTVFVEKVKEAVKGTGLDLKVLEVDDMRRLKMGALLAVARGSDEPAKMIVLRYSGGRKGGPMLALVGKGITFDSGGISIKPAQNMEMMKSDMGGGAAVVGAMLAIAELEPKINVIGIVPTTENMPSGKAIKPGDVVTGSGGKTIEIINTDAEGRLILSDGITYAVKEGATHIIDIATLTGSIVRTLGPLAIGAFGNDPPLMDRVRRAADLAGERIWELPTWADYDGLIDSEIADIKNSTVPWAGATTAALFLREFVEGRPWVHLDIAGSAWQDASELKTVPRGPTGSGVRVMAQLARLLAES
ncbi:MAG: leucyl aminopeptidase [Chloroflexota bacterium]|nr:MAG: leucyl aminopeptidase [Chloroflexota bacterium]TMD83201.1 MAG: leucyl aminopeptidase [Chloroflexota bacterium]